MCVCEREREDLFITFPLLDFRCLSEERPIPGNFVCDRILDCIGGEDELNCAGRVGLSYKPCLSLHPGRVQLQAMP